MWKKQNTEESSNKMKYLSLSALVLSTAVGLGGLVYGVKTLYEPVKNTPSAIQEVINLRKEYNDIELSYSIRERIAKEIGGTYRDDGVGTQIKRERQAQLNQKITELRNSPPYLEVVDNYRHEAEQESNVAIWTMYLFSIPFSIGLTGLLIKGVDKMGEQSPTKDNDICENVGGLK